MISDQQIIALLLSLLSFGFLALTGLFWRLWATLATKTELERLKHEITKSDAASDKEWAEPLWQEIRAVRQQSIDMHNENKKFAEGRMQEFKKIEDMLITLLARK